MNIDVPYGLTKRLNPVTLDARGRVTEPPEQEGFAVITEISKIDVPAPLDKRVT